MRPIDILITNNPKCCALHKMFHVEHYDVSVVKILEIARDLVHRGHRLLTHPLASSLKPNESPFKSVLVSGAAAATDFRSVEIIESAIAMCLMFGECGLGLAESVLEDFAQIDFGLVNK